LESSSLQQQTYIYNNQNVAETRFGSTMVPNRIFVGGLANGTSEQELRNFFSVYGEVKVVKIVKDKGGALKGFGFITFNTEEEVKKIIDAVSLFF
jgi:RNA recognition motif-containing protein